MRRSDLAAISTLIVGCVRTVMTGVPSFITGIKVWPIFRAVATASREADAHNSANSPWMTIARSRRGL